MIGVIAVLCVLAFLVVLGLLFGIDALLRWFMKSGVRFDMLDAKAPTSRLIVYVPGILADGVQSSDSIRDGWLAKADVVTISYDGQRFRPNRVVEAVAGRISCASRKYDRITVIGSSMGGLIAYDAIELIRECGWTVDRIDLVLVDSPTSSSDFAMPIDVTFLECSRDNVTVQSGRALARWREIVTGRWLRLSVDSTHCGFIERPASWNRVFAEIL